MHWYLLKLGNNGTGKWIDSGVSIIGSRLNPFGTLIKKSKWAIAIGHTPLNNSSVTFDLPRSQPGAISRVQCVAATVAISLSAACMDWLKYNCKVFNYSVRSTFSLDSLNNSEVFKRFSVAFKLEIWIRGS